MSTETNANVCAKKTWCTKEVGHTGRCNTNAPCARNHLCSKRDGHAGRCDQNGRVSAPPTSIAPTTATSATRDLADCYTGELEPNDPGMTECSVNERIEEPTYDSGDGVTNTNKRSKGQRKRDRKKRQKAASSVTVDGTVGVSVDGTVGVSVDGTVGVSVDGTDGVSVDGTVGVSVDGTVVPAPVKRCLRGCQRPSGHTGACTKTTISVRPGYIPQKQPRVQQATKPKPLPVRSRKAVKAGTVRATQFKCLRKEVVANGGRSKWTGTYWDNTTEVVSCQWVKENFDTKIGRKFLKRFECNLGRDLYVPVGDSQTRSDQVGSDLKGLSSDSQKGVSGTPEIRYQQGPDAFCVFYGAANGLDFYGDKRVAKVVAARAEESMDADCTMRALKDLIESKDCPGWTVQTFGSLYDPLVETSPFPTVIHLRADDGGGGHAIVTVGDLIFDANDKYARPLNKESLDICAGKEMNGCAFAHSLRAYRLIPSEKLVKVLGKRKARD